MSICPKNKSSKARRDKRRANWKMQGLWFIQQKRNHCSGLIFENDKKETIGFGRLFF